VVDAASAPAYIAGSAWPHGLYYQPVEGGIAGLWSAKWWALFAQNLVGTVGFYYLGPSYGPPIPGGTNPVTGETTPNPIAPGSFYYDLTATPPTVMFWNGSSWAPPTGALTPGYLARYVYIATAGQTVFNGPDINGKAPAFSNEGHDVHLNGVRLLPTTDFVANDVTDSMTIAEAPGAGAIVQWDLLVPADKINSAAMDAFKVQPLDPDGVATSFALNYINPATGSPAPCAVGSGAQLLVNLDGVVQEPGIDYTAVGATLTLAVAPRDDAKLWAVWYRPHIATGLP
jgi:hypothetical protein